jgi:hypothetical protein
MRTRTTLDPDLTYGYSMVPQRCRINSNYNIASAVWVIVPFAFVRESRSVSPPSKEFRGSAMWVWKLRHENRTTPLFEAAILVAQRVANRLRFGTALRHYDTICFYPIPYDDRYRQSL